MMKYCVFFRSLLTIVLLGFMAQTRAEEKKQVEKRMTIICRTYAWTELLTDDKIVGKTQASWICRHTIFWIK